MLTMKLKLEQRCISRATLALLSRILEMTDSELLEFLENYEKTKNDSGGKETGNGKKFVGSIAWMLEVRKEILKVATDFILRYHHDFFQGDRKHPLPISIKGAVDYINDHSADFSLECDMGYTMFLRAIKNKNISVENKEYPMKFFFSVTKIRQDEIGHLLQKVLENDPTLSDSALSQKIYDETSLSLARRTITKYRGKLKIPCSRTRKETS